MTGPVAGAAVVAVHAADAEADEADNLDDDFDDDGLPEAGTVPVRGATGATVLVLGGTAEGRELATRLVTAGVPVISSLAGRVASPRALPGRTRTGGFGGVDGLAAFLSRERIAAVVDATHPFATRITANAARACARTGTPWRVLHRPPWVPGPADRWTAVADLAAAAEQVARMESDARVLLTVGRQGAGAFAQVTQRILLRAVDPPEGPLPPRTDVLLDRGPYTVPGELALMRRHGVDALVTKNSGGPATEAKLTAARELGLPVIVVNRPGIPDGAPTVPDAASAAAWIVRFVTP